MRRDHSQPDFLSGSMSPLVLLVWLSLQWAGLALVAERVPLAAAYPQPAEYHAVGMLLIIQFVASAIFSPGLCSGWRMSLAAATSAWVMLLAAAFLAGWVPMKVIPASGLIGLWLAGLWLWMGETASSRGRATIAAVASTYAAGLLLWYFRVDLNPDGSGEAGVRFGPALIAVTSPRSPPASAWWCIGAICLAGLVVRLLLRSKSRMGPSPSSFNSVEAHA